MLYQLSYLATEGNRSSQTNADHNMPNGLLKALGPLERAEPAVERAERQVSGLPSGFEQQTV